MDSTINKIMASTIAQPFNRVIISASARAYNMLDTKYPHKIMKENTNSNSGTQQDTTARLAYELWEKEGRPLGRDMEFWLKAEMHLHEEQKKQAAKQSVVVIEPQAFQASQRVTTIKVNDVVESNRIQKKLPKSRKK